MPTRRTSPRIVRRGPDRPLPPTGPCPMARSPERLVGLGFRLWMRGHATCDLSCWEQAWSLYVGELGLARAPVAVRRLGAWVGAVGRSTGRRIDVGPPCAAGFYRDECLAVSMIAACQHGTCPALRACVFALIESGGVDRVLDDAQAFADTMAAFDLVLSPASIVSTDVAAVNSLPM